MATVSIIVREVGQRFGHEGVVMLGSEELHETRVVPFGLRDTAHQLAEEWAVANGHQVAVKPDPRPVIRVRTESDGSGLYAAAGYGQDGKLVERTVLHSTPERARDSLIKSIGLQYPRGGVLFAIDVV